MPTTAQQFSISLVTPDGSIRTYDDWRLPTVGEMQSLQNRGKYSPTYDPNVPPNAANAHIVLNGNGASLEMNQPPQQTLVAYNITITATFQGKTDSSMIQIVPGVAPL